MKDEVVIALLVVLIIASAGAGYFVGDSGVHATTVTTTSVSQSSYATTAMVTTTKTVTEMETTTSESVFEFISTSTVYPVPYNVTVVLAPSGQLMNYAINAGPYSSSGSLGSTNVFSITPVYEGETITISVTLNCPGSTGPIGDGDLYVNGGLVSHVGVACGGNPSGQISYVL